MCVDVMTVPGAPAQMAAEITDEHLSVCCTEATCDDLADSPIAERTAK